MKLARYDTEKENNPVKAELKALYNKRAEEAEKMESALNDKSMDAETVEAVKAALNSITTEAEKIASMLESWDEPAEQQPEGAQRFNVVASMEMRSQNYNCGGKSTMENNKETKTAEVRGFQRYVTGGMRGMNEEEQRSLNISSAGAVLPTTIYSKLITDGKYSDLLHRATVFNEGGAGKLNIPIASNTAASWHEELAAGTEASPTLTKIELGGYELMRLVTMSAAAASMTEAGFEQTMLQLLSSEVIETLEESFISGTGIGQPKGLNNLAWVTSGDGQNAKVTAATETGDGTEFYPINAAYCAELIALLPQKYARNAVLLMNMNTRAKIARFGWAESSVQSYNATEMLNSIFGHEIVISEHVPDETVYAVDPAELYVRFSMPVQIEADRSSGFTSAIVNLRALCVVDAAWNPAACARLTKGAAA